MFPSHFLRLSAIKSRNYSTNLANPLKFVPKCSEASEKDVEALKQFINQSRNILVLTGAGISTESGIPDYRSEEVGLYARTNHKPIQHQEFLKHPHIRRRYWARNFVGWESFRLRQPNLVHYSIRNLELVLNKVSCVVTQNVDNLHFKAGSRNVIELHGSAYRVVCLNCRRSYDRQTIQEELKEANPHMTDTVDMIRPDGDVDIPQEAVEGFKPPLCRSCAHVLKPDIVFFGDNVPEERARSVRKAVTSSDALLILGTSLSVFSGYRIVLQGVEEKKKIAMVNIGKTRGDGAADLKITARCGDVLSRICCT